MGWEDMEVVAFWMKAPTSTNRAATVPVKGATMRL